MIEKLNNMDNYTTTTTMDKNLNMMSLFDYLGRPAGPALGRQVARAASQERIKLEERQVSTKKFKGSVLLYPKYFLDKYFHNSNINSTSPYAYNTNTTKTLF